MWQSLLKPGESKLGTRVSMIVKLHHITFDQPHLNDASLEVIQFRKRVRSVNYPE
ncbi:hypothetical protein ACG94X_01190 [Acinetobacter sp. ULE_I010]|uniref:hypothetical protein n=1 Tax=Acinetobacter sp. ULE_I010 TaxID=3373065 RepID=UPI003AF43081